MRYAWRECEVMECHTMRHVLYFNTQLFACHLSGLPLYFAKGGCGPEQVPKNQADLQQLPQTT